MRPPALARLLLGLLLRGEGGEFVRGDIEEEYGRMRAERGRRAADRWYRRQAVASVWAWIGRAGEGTLERVWWDVRYGLRGLRRAPGYALSTVLTAGIGIGGVVSVLALTQTVYGPLPFPDPDRLVAVSEVRDGAPRSVAPANYLDWRRASTTVDEMAAYDVRFASLTVDGVAQRGAVSLVSGNFFRTLRVPPALGRTFDPTLDPGFPGREAVLSHSAWRDLFGADPDVVGRTVQVDDVTYEVVGVAPAEMSFPAANVSAWLRSRTEAPEISGFPGDLPTLRDAWYFDVVGRLAEGATLTAARAELDAIGARLREAHPDTNEGAGVSVRSLLDVTVAGVRPLLTALAAAVALVLLAAMVNVSHLMLARGDGRATEVAVRSALGAGRGALFRQAGTEGALIGLGGALLGLAGAHLTLGVAASRLATTLPRTDELALRPSTVALALGVGVGTALLVASLVHLAGRPGLVRARLLRTRGATASRFVRGGLVGAQIAAAIALLSGSVLLGRSLRALGAVELGFAEHETVTLRVAIPDARARPYELRIQAYERLVEVVRSVPGVQAVGYGSSSPLSMGSRASLFRFGRTDERGDAPDAGWQPVSLDFLEALGLPLLRGRAFEPGDDQRVDDVGIVNQTLARERFGQDDPIGRRVSIGLDGHDRPITIVGVVADTRTRGPAAEPGGVLYRPVAQTRRYGATAAFFAVRAPGADAELLARVREAIRAEDPALPVYSEALGTDLDRAYQTSQRSLLWILGVFSAVALTLGAVGVYGVAAHSVRRRRREIGVRMALGAHRRSVIAHVVGSGLARAALGVPLGMLAAVLLGRSLGSVLFGVRPADPLALAAVSAAVLGVATLALLVPARAAASTDPAEVTREE